MKKRYLLCIAALTVMLAAGCSSADGGEAPVTADDSSVVSEVSEEETTTAESVTTETEQETTEPETTAETETETEPEATETETTAEPETTRVPSGTEATSAELTAPVLQDMSVPQVQIELINIKQSYDTSYGSEIACATLVLNYLGFNVDEATLASYIPNADSTSPFTYSEVKKAIETYFSDNMISNYRVHEQSIDDCLLSVCYGYPTIIWATKDMKPSNSAGTKTTDDGEKFTLFENMQCFVLFGVDSDKFTQTYYDPITNSIVEYDWDDIEEVISLFSDQTYAFAIKGDIGDYPRYW